MSTLCDDWLDAQIQPPRGLGQPVLVLCRSSATATMVRAWIARRGGFPGLEVATARGLARQINQPPLSAPATASALPTAPGSVTARIAERPGLVALARRWTRTARLHLAADPSLEAPAWLGALADTSWSLDSDTQALTQLLDRVRLLGRKPFAAASWRRVVLLGFEAPTDPWTQAVGRHLAGELPTPATPVFKPLVAHHVPDVAAEARLAAQHADAQSVVLVASDATAARVHRALLRNGVPSAFREATRLERHTLASVIRACVTWFEQTDSALKAVDLDRVLKHPMIGNALPPPAQIWLEQALNARGDDDARTTLSRRELARAIRRARHLDAPLSQWIAALEALVGRDDEPHVPARALRLLARLRVLRACMQNRTFQDEFGGDAPEEDENWGDFDALVAALTGDQHPEVASPPSEPGTLGALRRFLLACHVRTDRHDRAALRILGALREGASLPATRSHATEILRGVAEHDEVGAGVQVLHYDDYDGRPASTLILCDVHDHGLTRRPLPDPLLTLDEQTRLGVVDGPAAVEQRLSQLFWATERARRTVAVVTEADAAGRAVVAPVQLELTDAPERPAPYGLDLPLPEHRARAALASTTDPLKRPETDDPRLTHLAIQGTAEWIRAGRGPRPSSTPQSREYPTLEHLLQQRAPLGPDWVLPWLGHAPGVPAAGLPVDQEWSVSRLFVPLSHCLYQAYGRVILGIREPETIAEELDPRELGQAVHDALELSALQLPWRYDGQRVDAEQRFGAALAPATEAAFAAATERFGVLSPIRAAATEGLQARWQAHWRLYARNRARPARKAEDWKAASALLYRHPLRRHLVDLLVADARVAQLPAVGRDVAGRWVEQAVQDGARGTDIAARSDEDLCGRDRGALPRSWAPVLRELAQHRLFAQLVQTWRRALFHSRVIHHPLSAVAAELPFGESEAGAGALGRPGEAATARVHLGPVALELGREPIAVRGRIDRVMVAEINGHKLAQVVDYKTAKTAPSPYAAWRRLVQLSDPQLLIYALALREAARTGTLPEPLDGARIAAVGWDYVRAAKPSKELVDAMDGVVVDDTLLDRIAKPGLGMLLDRARDGEWSLSPRQDTCPQLSGYNHDYCPLKGACRLRGLPRDTP